MKPLICQSCGLPFTDESKGTDRDQTKSEDYCINCFQNGSFVEPSLSLRDMEARYFEKAEKNENLTLEEAEEALKILHTLKRWRIREDF
ncbi:MAG: zinc ribbon domain-containing protein [Gillisia sp.]|nr:zinc ribbon domain-containing protein [Gillisia sp.]